ncbi:hypothetical protein [Acinetobacter soli]|uniref:hypothetical protein n=1 Tax=Acinetobacter soli TaxID=487316 RepID=UPI001D0A4476|nr:hypothetical protein [Acinetobacter soli]MCB8770153.1 hypothetical protein [Acinetobacter soli]
MDKYREAFEKHYLSLPFHTEWSAQICLDACSFDVKQDAYLPKLDWISSNDADECVIYCCMLNTAYLSFKEQQKRIDGLQARVDAFKAQSEKLRECSKSCVYNEREKNILLSQADDIDQILGVEQALKGGEV